MGYAFLERPIGVLPLVARGNYGEHVPMLRNLPILHAKEVIVHSGRLGPCLNDGEHEITFRDVAARQQDRRATGLRYARDPRFHARGAVADLGCMLRVVVALDELIDAIKAQLDRHDLLEGANERSILLGPVAIDDRRWAIDLGMVGRIRRSLELLATPMLDDSFISETEQVK